MRNGRLVKINTYTQTLWIKLIQDCGELRWLTAILRSARTFEACVGICVYTTHGVVWMRTISHRLRYLNTWPPVDGTFDEVMGKEQPCWKKYSTGRRLWVFSLTLLAVSLASCWDESSQLPAPAAMLTLASLPFPHDGLLSSGTTSRNDSSFH